VIKRIAPLPLLFKKAEHEKIAWQAILAKEPPCGNGIGKDLGRVKKVLRSEFIYLTKKMFTE
jgi:hypothetical protein